jgi:hypothetical protein
MDDFELALESDPWNKCDILNFTGCIKFQSRDKGGAPAVFEKVLSRNKGLPRDLKIGAKECEELMSYKGSKS